MLVRVYLSFLIGISLIFCAVCVVIELHLREDDDIDEDFFYLEKLCEGGEINEK